MMYSGNSLRRMIDKKGAILNRSPYIPMKNQIDLYYINAAQTP